MTDHSGLVWTPPVYECSKMPSLEWSSKLVTDESYPHDFARMAKWCPDGSAALAQCESGSFQFLGIPPQLLDKSEGEPTLSYRRNFRQPSPILDFTWFPTATIRDPASFCFIASVRECPVKLLDATDGRLRASYRIVDHRERFIAPHGVTFNMTADKLYCGFEDAIEVFDVHRPGEGSRLHTTPSRKSRDGLKGIVSALAFSSDVSSGIYAAGTLSPSTASSPNIALFSEATGEVPVMSVGDARSSLGTSGIRVSVIQLAFNPTRPYLLYASFRRHDTIYEWDLRSDVHVPIRTFHRRPSSGTLNRGRGKDPTSTNQKLRFDIDIGGQLLGVGDQHGSISLFDLVAGDVEVNPPYSGEVIPAPPAGPALQYDAHMDAVGSVSFHPLRPIVLSVSGSRHFSQSDKDPKRESTSMASGSDTGSDDSEDGLSEGTSAPHEARMPMKISRRRLQPVTLDASVKCWSFEAGSCSKGTEMHGANSHAT